MNVNLYLKQRKKKNHNLARGTKNPRGQNSKALTTPTWKGLVMSGAT